MRIVKNLDPNEKGVI